MDLDNTGSQEMAAMAMEMVSIAIMILKVIIIIKQTLIIHNQERISLIVTKMGVFMTILKIALQIRFTQG